MTRHKTRYPGVYYRLTASGERRYQISYPDSTGRRIFKTVEGNERDALRERNQILERMHRGEKVVRSRLTVQELGEDYLRSQSSSLKEGTKTDYGYALDHWVFPRLGTHRVAEVDVNTIADFVAEMGQLYSGSTVRNCLKPLSRMFAYATRRGWMAQNPVSQLDRSEMPKGSPRRMRILDTQEIQSLLGACTKGYRWQDSFGSYHTMSADSVYKTLFMAAIFAGLRRGELLALTWADVDLLQASVSVREGKTEASAREVAIPDFLVQALATAALVNGEGRVFPFSERNVTRALTTALERAGIEHIRFHDLRHTFASILIGQGEDVTYVADQMGHASPATTLKLYSHLFDGAKRKEQARAKMQESFKEVVG